MRRIETDKDSIAAVVGTARHAVGVSTGIEKLYAHLRKNLTTSELAIVEALLAKAAIIGFAIGTNEPLAKDLDENNVGKYVSDFMRTSIF